MRHYNDLTYLGKDAPNVDHATGIRVGFISQHTVAPEALDDIITQGEDLTHAAAVTDAKARLSDALRPVLDDLNVLPYGLTADREKASQAYLDDVVGEVWDRIEQDFNDRYESNDSAYRYERDGYVIEYGSSGTLAVIRSPYYTFAAFGSPCIPNAGDLDTPRTDEAGGIKTYCLGHDWFEEGAPYPVFEATTDAEVIFNA